MKNTPPRGGVFLIARNETSESQSHDDYTETQTRSSKTVDTCDSQRDESQK